MTSPTPKQTAQLLCNDILEGLYGGAAGGGKSEGLLQLASQFVEVPRYSAILFRRTFRDLSLPGALLDRSHSWWARTDAHWDGLNYTWRFPSGATVAFGYLDRENDHLRYQSAEFQMVGFDELTQFRENQYRYMFSRLRRLKDFPVPIRARAATNPGGPGHEWVKKRFNLPKGPPPGSKRFFISATLDDNPFIDQDEYEVSLSVLGHTIAAQLRSGDWTVQSSGGRFDTTQFRIIGWGDLPNGREFESVIRYWDLAATEPTDDDPDPDWTAGVKMGVTRIGRSVTYAPDYYIFDVVRDRLTSGGVNALMRETAARDGAGVSQWVEQERGGSGKLVVGQVRDLVLPTHTVRGLYVTGSKETRILQLPPLAADGRVYLVDGLWVDGFLAEAGAYPQGHDDQLDAAGSGIIALEREKVFQKPAQGVQH